MEINILIFALIAFYLIYRIRNGFQGGAANAESIQTVDLETFRMSEESFIRMRMSYYLLLDEDEKNKFLSRTLAIKGSLRFVSREEGFEVTDEMMVLISASLAQLTFGWTEIMPPHLEQVDLFSDSFYSRLAGAEVKGLTLPHRVMLSWRYFQEGYQINNDKVNLGLHEMAHSIWDESYWDYKVKDELEQWTEVANTELQKLQRHIDSDFFRDYAATNAQELWACSVECFFEAPVEFQQKLPDLYNILASLLNQDMASRMQESHFIRPPAVIPPVPVSV